MTIGGLLEEFDKQQESFMNIANEIYAIRKIDEEIEQIKQNAREAADFYAKQAKSLEFRKEQLKGLINGYLESTGKNKITTHLGTAYIATRKDIVWGLDDELTAFAESQNIPLGIRKTPNMKVIKEYCIANSVYPPSFSSKLTSSIVVKDPRGMQEEPASDTDQNIVP